MRVTCPDCSGEGRNFAIICGPGVSRSGRVPCSTCRGAGHITEGHGERMRRDRVSRGVRLRAEAGRLNVAPEEWSHIEQGGEPETDEGRRALETRLREIEASA